MTSRVGIKNSGFIARPDQSLEEHLLGVSDKAKKFAAKIGLESSGELIGLLHDFGKYSNQFQKYICSAIGELNPDADDDYVDAEKLKGKIDHSTAGAQWIWQQLKNFGKKGQGELCAQILSLCIVSHHSGLIDCLKPDCLESEKINNFKRRIEKKDDETNYMECCKNAHEIIIEKAKQLATTDLVAGMLKKIKLFLNSDKSEIISNFYLGFFARFLFSCLIDADRIDSASVENPIYLEIQNRKVDWSIAIDRFEQAFAAFKTVNPVDKWRQKISQDCYKKSLLKQGIYTLTVPTGGGKTFASLR